MLMYVSSSRFLLLMYLLLDGGSMEFLRSVTVSSTEGVLMAESATMIGELMLSS
jgi:hypothetical protein